MPSVGSKFHKPFDQGSARQHSKPVKNNTDKFLSTAQTSANKTGDPALMAEANEAALAEAIQKSLHDLNARADEKRAHAHAYFADTNQANNGQRNAGPRPTKGDFLSKQQIYAMETGDAESIKEANAEALAMGMRISRSETKPTSQRMRSVTNPNLIPELEHRGRRQVNEKLRNWFTAHDLRVVPNSGNSNNCLLISLLQHATKNYQSDHLDKAQHYKALLCAHSNGDIGLSDSLFEDTALISRLIHQINKDHDSDICVEFYTGNFSDQPGVGLMGTGRTPVIIFNQGGHFEAVIPVSKQ